MINSVSAGILSGAVVGALSGWGSRLALKKTINSADKIFYSVFTAGFFCRLALLIAAVCLLRRKKDIIVISFTVSCILMQLAFEAFPLKKNGVKRNS